MAESDMRQPSEQQHKFEGEKKILAISQNVKQRKY